MIGENKRLKQIWVRADQRNVIKQQAAMKGKTIPSFIDELLIKGDKKVKDEFKYKTLF